MNESDDNNSNLNMEETQNDVPKTIRHLVVSGGGGSGLSFYGILKQSNKDGFWNIKNIRTMHGISVGSIMLTMVSLIDHISWEDYDDFIIKRPWETFFGLSPDVLFNAYSNIGLFSRYPFEQLLEPILKAVDMTLDVNLQQFYEFTGIEFHFYVTNFDEFELVDISYKTHPEWTLINAIYSSCALPILFPPNLVNGTYFADGAFLCNFPINQCLKMVEDPAEIFGIKKVHSQTDTKKKYANLVEYLMDIIPKAMHKMCEPIVDIPNTFNFVDNSSPMGMIDVLKTRESRALKIEDGVIAWKQSQFRLRISDL